MKGFFKKTFSGFQAIDENSMKIVHGYKLGELVEIEVKKKRNIKFHRKFFGVLDLTFQNQELTERRDDFREAVTIEAGYYHSQKQLDGTETKRADSISFANMEEHTFSELYNKVFDICLSILGCKSEELELELLKFD